MEAVVKIQKWGNDLGINIPPAIANDLSLKEGLFVSVYENGNRIIIEPSKQNVSYNLDNMLSRITKSNIHLKWKLRQKKLTALYCQTK